MKRAKPQAVLNSNRGFDHGMRIVAFDGDVIISEVQQLFDIRVELERWQGAGVA